MLQIAISKSHGADTAEWLRETAAACIDMGLQASKTCLMLHPVSYQNLANRMQAMFPQPSQLLAKLQGKAGLKYFAVSGTSDSPSTVSIKISDIIVTTGRNAAVELLLTMIKVVPEQHDVSDNPGPPLLPAEYTRAASSASTAASTWAAQDSGTSTVSTMSSVFLPVQQYYKRKYINCRQICCVIC